MYKDLLGLSPALEGNFLESADCVCLAHSCVFSIWDGGTST